MPDGARILRFPGRRFAAGDLAECAGAEAIAFLDLPFDARSDEGIQACFSNSDTTLAVCQLLKARCDSAPAAVAQEAIFAHKWIATSGRGIGVFDEKDYFLGELALIAANAYRQLGRLVEAEKWIDKAEAGFRHTVNPAPLLAAAAFVRLAVRYAATKFEDVLELLPSLIASFERFGMQRELAKSRFLEAAALKETGRLDEAICLLRQLRTAPAVRGETAFLGRVLASLGHHCSEKGEFAEATRFYSEALPALREGGLFGVVAEIKWGVGDAYRAQRLPSKAIGAYREAIGDFEQLGLVGTVSLLHLVIAELLLEVGSHREAEWEVLAALPTLEQEQMLPAGVAAIALLRESVRQRKMDPKALLELREYLQTKS
jgi:tetratricopeptide (TPR) repeat protein